MKNFELPILILTGYYYPGFKGGGPIKTIRNTVETVSQHGIDCRIITGDRDLGDKVPFNSVKINEWNLVGETPVMYTSTGLFGLFRLIHHVRAKGYAFLYINSFFSLRYSIIPQIVARLYKQKVLVCPRGEFSSGALTFRSLKKSLYIHLYKFLGFDSGVVFQASSDHEKKDIVQALGEQVDIRVSRNIGESRIAKEVADKDNGKLHLVMLCRISKMKNIVYALEVLSGVDSSVVLDIFGPIEDEGYWRECKNVIDKLPSNIEVNHKGLVRPEKVIETLSEYDIFFLPTLGENYGHVIAEALCAGLPVLISDNTPWRELESQGIGWDISLNEIAKFRSVINEMAGFSTEEFRLKREQVLEWSNDKLSQRDEVNQVISLFNYVGNK